MKPLNILKQNPLKTWRWVAIIFICLFCMQTCSKCSRNQNHLFEVKGNQEVIDSLIQTNHELHDSILILNGDLHTYKHSATTIDFLQQSNQELHDSILILNGSLRACERSNRNLQSENDNLRNALERSQNKPVIIYKEKETSE